jgi:LCP family protein required for cell wall assembly
VSEENPPTREPSPESPSEAASELPADVVPAHQRRSRRSRILRASLATFVVLVLLASASAAYAYHYYNGKITAIPGDTAQAPGVIRPSASPDATSSGGKKITHDALNILVLGSDSRLGDNTGIGGEGEGGSDTAIVLHLSASRKWAVGASIPRDSMVQMPDCRRADYAIGGPLCARDTVEQLTHLRIDHFMVVDFAGFRSMVNAIGGVNVCLTQPIDDGSMHLHLPAGKQKLDGLQALGLVRVRHIGSGSDLDRIKRQQTFISALIQQVTSARTLFDPHRLLPFISAATKSLTVDKGLGSLRKLADLGRQVRGIGLDKIQFVTVPNQPYPPDPNRVQWTPAAMTMWQLLANDEPLPGTAAAKTGGASPSPTPTPTGSPLVAAPSTISVRVLNGSGKSGAATKAANELRALGYNVVGVGDTARVSATVVRWSPPRDESARTLAAATGSETEQTTGLGQIVDLVVGPDYASAHAVTVTASTGTSTPSPTPSFGGRTANQDICS